MVMVMVGEGITGRKGGIFRLLDDALTFTVSPFLMTTGGESVS
jgi:hypothetical protein